jgi:hypothetical protein
MSAAGGEQSCGLVPHHAPVGDRHELGPAVPGIDPQVVDDVVQMLRAAGVLDVEEDRAPARGPGPLGLRRRHARGEPGLDRRDGK